MNAQTTIDAPEGSRVLPGELPEVRILRLQPGDVLAICLARHITHEQAEEIHRRCAAVWPDNQVALFEVVESVFVLRKEGDD